jgi:hypothetical protein
MENRAMTHTLCGPWREAYRFLMRRFVPNRTTIRQGLLAFIGLAGLLAQPFAAADLMLHPTRLVFEKNQRAAQLDLINNGQETATYRIHLANRRMSETGEFSGVDTPAPNEQFADGMLRYSPRQVTLAPGTAQTVRIMLRKPAGLAPGEYRSHLMFERVAEARAQTSIEERSRDPESTLEIRLTPLIGVSIPLIVRHGQTSAVATISNVELLHPTNGQPAIVAFELRRSGNRSVYGDLTVTFTPGNGAEQRIASAGGVAVYTPNPLRRIKMQFQSGVAPAHGTLRVVYRGRPEEGGKVLAEAVIQIP